MLKDHFGGIGDADLEADMLCADMVDLIEQQRTYDLETVQIEDMQWRFEAFQAEDMYELPLPESGPLAALSVKYFDTPQDALAAWNDGDVTERYAEFEREAETVLRAEFGAEVRLTFSRAAAEEAAAPVGTYPPERRLWLHQQARIGNAFMHDLRELMCRYGDSDLAASSFKTIMRAASASIDEYAQGPEWADVQARHTEPSSANDGAGFIARLRSIIKPKGGPRC